MTRFSELYSHIQDGEEVEDGLIKLPNGKAGACSHCGEETTFFETRWGAYICSEHCWADKSGEVLADIVRRKRRELRERLN